MTASDSLQPRQFPVYELGDPEYNAPERGYHVTAHEDDEEVHPSHFGFEVAHPPRNRQEGHTFHYESREVDVPLNRIKLTQDYVYKNHVQNLASIPGHAFHDTQRFDPVQADKVGDTYFIAHGHHRTVAAKVRGDKTVRAMLSGEWRPNK